MDILIGILLAFAIAGFMAALAFGWMLLAGV